MNESAVHSPELAHGLAVVEQTNQHLHRIAGQLERHSIEDIQTFAFYNAVAAFTMLPSVPLGPICVEAWQSGVTPVPAFILDGDYTTAGAKAILTNAAQTGYVPVLCSIPGQGVAQVEREAFSGVLTIVSLIAPATDTVLVTVRVRAHEHDRRRR